MFTATWFRIALNWKEPPPRPTIGRPLVTGELWDTPGDDKDQTATDLEPWAGLKNMTALDTESTHRVIPFMRILQ